MTRAEKVDVAAECYRFVRGELARADLTEHDGDRFLAAEELFADVLMAAGVDLDAAAHPGTKPATPR